MLASPEAGQDVLDTSGVTSLGIDGGSRHVRNGGISTSPWVLGVTHRVVLWCWLDVPDVATVTTELTRLESLCDILLDDNGTTGGVDQPSTWLHLGEELLVEQALGLLVERAVDGDNITLGKHVLEALNATAANLLLLLLAQRLVVVVEELLAVESLQSAKDTLTDTADSDGTDNLVLEVVLVLGDSSDFPVTTGNHLVRWDKVTDEGEDGHDDVLSDGDDVGASDFSDGDTAVCLVGSIEVDVVRTNTGSDGDLELLGLGQALSGQVTRVEAAN